MIHHPTSFSTQALNKVKEVLTGVFPQRDFMG
jgi:hypothetical protein